MVCSYLSTPKINVKDNQSSSSLEESLSSGRSMSARKIIITTNTVIRAATLIII
jgi:hypothetical protein